MLRVIALCLSVLAFATSANAQQKTAPSMEAWMAEQKANVAIKDEGISSLINYRDHICPLQTTVEKKADCKSKFTTIVDRRKTERDILLGEINVYSKLRKNEAMVILEITNPAYQKIDAETTTLFNVAYRLYPRQQASAN